jgi:serine/threonine protein kinase
MLVGTPHYSQPEQVLGTELVPASDVYSLGVVLYELLSAHMPLFAKEPCNAVRERLLDEPLQWLSAHVKRPLVPLDKYRDCRKRVPKRLMELVHWMLQKAPEDRPKSGGVVARQLASILHRELDTRVTAVMHLHDQSGTREVAFLIPGKQVLGTSHECLIKTASDGSNRVQATLSWGGIGTEAVLQPVAPFGGVRVDGQLLEQSVRLPPGTRIEAGRLRMHIEYPPVR